MHHIHGNGTRAAAHVVLAYLTFPTLHRTKLHSTNPLERLITEIKRSTDVVGLGGSLPTSLPNAAAIDRLVGAVLLEQNDEWQLQHRYLSLETIAEIPAGEEPLEITQLPPKAAWSCRPAGAQPGPILLDPRLLLARRLPSRAPQPFACRQGGPQVAPTAC